MSGLDKIIAAITPGDADAKGAQARERARAAASPGDWLSQVLDHHLRIERAFFDVRAAGDAPGRGTARKTLATILTAHAVAEEAVLYPALARVGHKSQASAAYAEQSEAKIGAADLERLDPLDANFLDQLGRLEEAVRAHLQGEERSWLPELRKLADPADHDGLSRRYGEEFSRYMNGAEAAPIGRRGDLETRPFGGAPA